MAMVDVGGGEYRDLDTGTEYTIRQFCDVIAEKISPEFADLIGEMLDETSGDFAELQEEYDNLDQVTDEWLEVFQRVSNQACEFARMVDGMPRMDRKKIVSMFEEIENEVNQYT